MAKPPKGPLPVSGGPIHAVVCPHCGHPNDCRELQLTGGDTMLYRGAEIDCDKCHMMSVVTMVQPVTFVQLRPLAKRAPVTGAASQQAHTISQAQANRLLKGR